MTTNHNDTPMGERTQFLASGPQFVVYLDDEGLTTAINLNDVFQVISSVDGPLVSGASFIIKEKDSLISIPTNNSFSELMSKIYYG